MKVLVIIFLTVCNLPIILDSGVTCHMIPQISDIIPCSLKDKDKHIEVAGRYHVTERKKG